MPDHRSLQAWKESRALALCVLEASKTHWRPWASACFSQVLRASLSVQLNIAEGWSFGDSPTCTRHLGIAYGSAMETADLVDLMLDAGVVPQDVGERLRQHSVLSRRLLVGLLKRRRPLS